MARLVQDAGSCRKGESLDMLNVTWALFRTCPLQVRLDELCFVGDRLLTDVVFGNLNGMLTVHTRPLTLEGDNRPATVFRFLERKVSV